MATGVNTSLQDDCNSIKSSMSSCSSSSNCSAASLLGNTPPASPINNRLPLTTVRKRNHKKCELLTEGEIQVCRLNHTRTIVSKIMNSKYLRRWETHTLILTGQELASKTPVGFMETAIPYFTIEDVNIISRWDAGQKFCLRITIPDGSLLLQAKNCHIRDEWLHSVQWKRNMLKYHKLLEMANRQEIILKEIKNMIDMALTTPIQDCSVYEFPLEVVSQLLQKHEATMNQATHEEIIITLTPLLERHYPTQEICDFFTKHCQHSPRSKIVIELFTPVVHRILKHNTDFGKFPRMRTFIQEYIQAVSSQNQGLKVVREFVQSMHGLSSRCPHLRILTNLVSVCLAGIYNCYEDKKCISPEALNDNAMASDMTDYDYRLKTYLVILTVMAEYEDWRPNLGSLLQPIPFTEDVYYDPNQLFQREMAKAMHLIANDVRCDVHTMVLPIREGKRSWFQLYCPGNEFAFDDGALFSVMLKRLLCCCCRRKRFVEQMPKMISPCMLLALRECEAAMDMLCAVLEFDVVENADTKMQIITTLQSTDVGKRMYAVLCEKQIKLRELQSRGGPRKLTLPSKSTDHDLAKMLSSGSFGNLECLSLAFTQVTSDCARDLIKLPALKYLNLWSTQFGDQGLQLICEHMVKLQVLNLCETPVTDKGLSCLASMTSLRRLNLNSTHLSALTFEEIKEKLPALQECDVRYTDAW